MVSRPLYCQRVARTGLAAAAALAIAAVGCAEPAGNGPIGGNTGVLPPMGGTLGGAGTTLPPNGTAGSIMVGGAGNVAPPAAGALPCDIHGIVTSG